MTRIIITILFVTSYFSLQAQTDSSKRSTTSFVYSVDAYYRYDLNDAPSGNNNLTSFTNSKNSFELGMASIRADHSFGKVSATADLGFGRRAQEFSYNDVGTLVSVKQMFISYAPTGSVKFTIGKWATHIGYEMVDAYLNRNYSMSYGFSYGPFFHTGIKADISLGGKNAIMIGVSNPTDFSTTTSSNKVLLLQYSTATHNDKLKAFFNFQGGEGFSQFDLVLNGNINKQFSINYDGTYRSAKITSGRSNWTSNALYLNYDPINKFGLTLRGEYFDDKKSLAGIGTNVFETTLSGNIHLDNLTLIPEIRMENAGNTIFSKSNGNATTSALSCIIAAVYKF